MKKRVLNIAERLTGFSTPIFGLSWNPPAIERDQARELLSRIEDFRVLYNPYEAEVPHHCVMSVERLRHVLTDTIVNAKETSLLENSARHMRAACREFLNKVRDEGVVENAMSGGHWASFVFLPSLGDLRTRVGTYVAVLAAAYNLEVEEELQTILPPPLDNDEDEYGA